jgi:hypothetical protein
MTMKRNDSIKSARRTIVYPPSELFAWASNVKYPKRASVSCLCTHKDCAMYLDHLYLPRSRSAKRDMVYMQTLSNTRLMHLQSKKVLFQIIRYVHYPEHRKVLKNTKAFWIF